MLEMVLSIIVDSNCRYNLTIEKLVTDMLGFIASDSVELFSKWESSVQTGMLDSELWYWKEQSRKP